MRIDVRIGGRDVRDFCFLNGSAALGWMGRAVVQPVNGVIFAGFSDSDMTGGTWRSPRAVSVRAVETCSEQAPRPCGGDSGAHWKGTKCGRS